MNPAVLVPSISLRAIEENQARRKAEEMALKRLQENQVKEESVSTSQAPALQKTLMDEMSDRLYRDRKVAVSIGAMALCYDCYGSEQPKIGTEALGYS